MVRVLACVASLAGAALVYLAMHAKKRVRQAGVQAETAELANGCKSLPLQVVSKAATVEVLDFSEAQPGVCNAPSAGINLNAAMQAASATDAPPSAQLPGKAVKQPRCSSPYGSTAYTQLAKKSRHHASKKVVKVCKPVAARSPAELGAALLAHGVLPQRIDSFGCKAGQWVADDSILRLLDALCSDRASSYTFGATKYELAACYLDSCMMTVDLPDEQCTEPPTNPQLILVVHTYTAGIGQHFSSIIINPEQQLVHAFDTLGRWPDSRVAAVLQSLYPNLDLFGQYCYDIGNHTGKISQTGATCGAWSLWLLVAYVFNYSSCRDAETDDVDCAVLKNGALQFWHAVTH